jgi:RNA polymerase sigma-70 factor (ECF subfamily)
MSRDFLNQDVLLRAIARGLLRDEHLADDAVQETWLTYLRGRRRRPRSLTRLLRKITHDHAVDIIRTNDRRRDSEALCPRPEASLSADEETHLAQVKRQLADAVESLAPRYRTALKLRYYEDLPPREISRRLGIPVETVHTHHKRGLELLRQRLDREFSDGINGWPLAWPALLPYIYTRGFGRVRAVLPVHHGLAAIGAIVGVMLVLGSVLRHGNDTPGVLAGPAPRGLPSPSLAVDPIDGPRSEATVTLGVRAIVRGDGRPVTSVQVEARWSGGSTTGTTDDTGRADLRVPRAAPVHLVVAASAVTGSAFLDVPATTLQEAPHGNHESVVHVPSLRIISGSTLDTSGDPVAGVPVQLWLDGTDRLRGNTPDIQVISNARGVYELHAAPRSFVLNATTDTWTSCRVLWARDLGVGLHEEFDVTLVAAGSLRLRALAPDGAPLSNVMLFATPEGGVVRSRAHPGVGRIKAVSVAATDAGGYANLADLPRGPYIVTAQRKGYGPAWTLAFPSTDGDLHEIRLPQVELGTVVVHDESGAPLAGAHVRLWRSVPHRRDEIPTGAPQPLQEVDSGADGQAHFGVLLGDGELLLEVSAPDYAPQYVGPMRAPLKAHVQLRKSAPLEGWVLDSSGSAFVKTRVFVRPRLDYDTLSETGFGRFCADSLTHGVAANEAGYFRVDDAPRGDLELFVLSQRSDDSRVVIGRELRSWQRTVQVQPDASSSTLTGQVVDASTGRPVEGSCVTIAQLPLCEPVVTGPDGRYAFDVPAGQNPMLAVTAEGFAPSFLEVPRASTQVELYRSRRITAEIVDEKGLAVSCAFGQLMLEDASPVLTRATTTPRDKGPEGIETVLSADILGEITFLDAPSRPLQLFVFVPLVREPWVFDVPQNAERMRFRLDTFAQNRLTKTIRLGMRLDPDASEPRWQWSARSADRTDFGGPYEVQAFDDLGRTVLDFEGRFSDGNNTLSPIGQMWRCTLAGGSAVLRRAPLRTDWRLHTGENVFGPGDVLDGLVVPASGMLRLRFGPHRVSVPLLRSETAECLVLTLPPH